MKPSEYSTHARPVTAARKRMSMRKVVLGAVVLVVLVGGAAGSYYVSVMKVVPSTMSMNASSTAEADVDALQDVVRRVQKLIILPDEEAVMYTVDDAEKLMTEQSFFTGSQNGDVLLVFSKSQKAVIYSPARNIIVNVGPVTYSEDATAEADGPQGAATTTSGVGTTTVQ